MDTVEPFLPMLYTDKGCAMTAKVKGRATRSPLEDVPGRGDNEVEESERAGGDPGLSSGQGLTTVDNVV